MEPKTEEPTAIEAGTAVFVLSSGRCGTQWLTNALREFCDSDLRVEHEPLNYRYSPRTSLGTSNIDQHPFREELLEHLQRVRRYADGGGYVETGWPAFGSIPLLRQALGSRMRIVHLTRDPIFSAASMLTHDYYGSAQDEGYTLHALLEPMDSGVRFGIDYASRWSDLPAFEKCLYLWTEIHSHIVEQEVLLRAEVPWIRISMEDLFCEPPNALRTLLEFCGVVAQDEIVERIRIPFDRYHRRTSMRIKWRKIFDHPHALRVSEELGYRLMGPYHDKLNARYASGLS